MFKFFTDSTKKRSAENEKNSFQCSLRRLSIDQGIGIPLYWQNVQLDLFPTNMIHHGKFPVVYFELTLVKEFSIILRGFYEYQDNIDEIIFYLEQQIGYKDTTFKKINVLSETPNTFLFDYNVSIKNSTSLQHLKSVNLVIRKDDGIPRWAVDDYWIGEVSLSGKKFVVIFQQYNSIYFRDIHHSKSWRVIHTDHETFQVDHVQYKVTTNFLTGEVVFSAK